MCSILMVVPIEQLIISHVAGSKWGMYAGTADTGLVVFLANLSQPQPLI